MDERGDSESGFDIGGAHSTRTVELVSGERERVHVKIDDLDGSVPDGLNGIGVERRAEFVRDGRKLADILQRADLVVREHDGDEDRCGRGGSGDQ